MLPLLAALVLAVAPTPTPTTFNDAHGDSGTAPDIAKVSLATSTQGQITFAVSFFTPYVASSSLYIYLDTDENQTTGDPSGAEYRLGPDGLDAWNATAQDFEPTGAPTSFTVASDGLSLTTTVDATDLGSPKGVDFVVDSLDGAGGPGHSDRAIGIWSKGSGGLLVVAAQSTPPKAGAVWTIALTADGGDPSVTADGVGVACSATIAKAKLALIRHVVLNARNGTASAICLFRVPKKLKKKSKFAGAMTMSIGAASVSKRYAATLK
jgi:hypothetical protein